MAESGVPMPPHGPKVPLSCWFCGVAVAQRSVDFVNFSPCECHKSRYCHG